ncbi:DNA-directed RNA polymerase subunit omega [Paraliomyxa miuraensis]|uniref:DNA-directed RNA polymerase subunit omega n=1 Tax=Paraliomyxa miuraensis TaxID=376150 RepID=UPI002B1CAE5C|nr:DNA-directed RNA polymerase subunit omega [Paraliomyxa miuraensis]
MARVTVEDCLARVPNRFALTILASRRARSLSEGRGRAMVECDNKEGVTALREISSDRVRYKEDVANTMVDFIEEQRRQLRVTTGEHTFLEAASLRALEDDDIDGDDGDDEDDDIEELQADPEALNKQAKKVTEDDEVEDEDEEEEGEEEEGESSDDEDADFGGDEDADFVPDDDDLSDDSEESEESEDEED